MLTPEQVSASPAQLRETLRYLDVNKPLFEGYVDSLPTNTAQEWEQLVNRFRLYRDAHYKDSQSLSALLAELSVLLPVTESDLRGAEAAAAYSAPAPAPATVVAPAAPAVAEIPQPAVAPEPAAAAPVPAPAAPEVEPAVNTPVATPIMDPVAAAPATPERAKPLVASVPPANTLNDKLASNRPVALNEKLAVKPSNNSIAEAQPKIESLRGAISINQRFSFINELFNGENMEYHTAIEHLDSLPNAEAARRYVNEDLAQRYQWVRKEEHVNKLLRLIDRKFA
jgi:hypothetical protein